MTTRYHMWSGVGEVLDFEDEDEEPQDDGEAITKLQQHAAVQRGDWTLWKRVDYGPAQLIACVFNGCTRLHVIENTARPHARVVHRELGLKIRPNYKPGGQRPTMTVPYHIDVDHDKLKKVREEVRERLSKIGGDPACLDGDSFDILYIVLRAYRPDLFNDSPRSGKYGRPEKLADVLKGDEPWFVLLGRDENAVGTLCDYTRRLEDGGGDPACIKDMREKVVQRFAKWQEAHPDAVKSVTGTGDDE